MAIVTYPLNGIMYNAENAETYLCTRTSGVYSADDNFSVQADGTMQVTVNPGLAWIKNNDFAGKSVVSTEPVILSFAMADGVLNRKDRIVLRFDVGENATNIVVKQGTPASTAEPKPIERTGTVYELGLYVVDIPAGTLGLSAANITSTMLDEEVCGIMRDGVTGIPTAQLQEQAMALMEQVAESVNQWEQEQTAEFEEWFEGIKGALGEDVAGNLLNMIQQETADRQAADSAIESKLGVNATAVYEESTVKITAPEGIVVVTFLAPSDCKAGDKYTLNGDALTLTDLNGEPVEDAWKQGSPVTFTLNGNKAFFKAGGSGKNDTLPPLLGNMTVEVVEGDENDTYTIKMDKLILDKTTEMVGGAQLEWGEEMPAKPGKGTGGIKTWTREESISLRLSELSELTEGDIVKINESGNPVDFYVAKHDYESSLNGAGRTLVVRKDCYDNRVWDNSNVSAYASSDLDSWFNSTYKNMLDADIRSLIGTTKIRYTPGNGNNTVGTLERAVFALSATELGQSASWFNVEGSTLPIASTLKIAHLNGSANDQWTRSPYTNDTHGAVYLSSDGDVDYYYYCSVSLGSRPAFTLPASAMVKDNGDGTYTFVDEVSYVTHTVEVPHGQKVVFRQFTQNQKKQFQTMLVGGVYPPLGDVEPPFKLPEFTGNHALFGDETAGRIEMYEAGELTLSPGIYDIFLVGGGSNGNNSQGGSNNGAGGGAGGYTKTIKGVIIEKLTPMIPVLVGAANSKTAITIGDQSYEALPGSVSSARYESGKDGGSGGGVGMYNGTGDISKFAPGLGGSDGSDGGSNNQNNFIAGKGQHTTTRAFEEEAGTLYSGAGSGGTASGRGYYAKPATEGGGGAGGNGSASSRNGGNATPNTGGGGGGAAGNGSAGAAGGLGASGILIIRWNNAA